MKQKLGTTMHINGPVIVEQLFGIWKRRFPCLYYGLRTKLSTTIAVICSVAILHNICILHRLDEDIDYVHDDVFEDVFNREDGIRLAHRAAFIVRHFS